MNILILSQWFDPEPNNMKALVFAKGLKERGHKVQVLTGLPNYPGGKLYPGYHFKLHQVEMLEQIAVHRVLLYPSHDSRILRRSLNYISFAFIAALVSPWVIQGKIDVIYVYHPPVTVMLPALILRKLKNAKILLDINDLWPDSIYSASMMKKSRITKLIHYCMNYSYKKADKINVLSSGIKALLIQRGVDEGKITTIPVWCNESLINSEKNQDFISRYGLLNRFIGMYAGAMGRAQNLSVLLKAAGMLAELLPDFILILIGDGICQEDLKAQVKREQLTNVIFIPLIPSGELTAVLNIADFLLIHLRNDPLFEVTIPSKAAYYLALGKPIIAGVQGIAANILEQSGSAIVCKPDDSQELVAAILKLFQLSEGERSVKALRGYEYYLEHMSMDAGISSFSGIMTEMSRRRETNI